MKYEVYFRNYHTMIIYENITEYKALTWLLWRVSYERKGNNL